MAAKSNKELMEIAARRGVKLIVSQPPVDNVSGSSGEMMFLPGIRQSSQLNHPRDGSCGESRRRGRLS